jgi:hypothetical protein
MPDIAFAVGTLIFKGQNGAIALLTFVPVKFLVVDKAFPFRGKLSTVG